MTCLTHHLACECREKEMRELFEEVFERHQNRPCYNYGDRRSPCTWCERAKKLLGVKDD